jgi:hypothetical protein
LIWYDFADASTITVTGAGISQITNKAASGGYTLTQSTDASRPSWDGVKATGRDLANVNGGLWCAQTVDWTNAAYLQLSTAQYGNFNGNLSREYRVAEALAGSTSNHTAWIEGSVNNAASRFNNADTGGFVTESGFTADTGLVIRSRTFSGIASGTVTTWKGGTQINTITNANINPVVGGALGLLARATNITLGDFLVTSQTSTANRQKMEGYLAWKWNISSQLPTSHPYRTVSPIQRR